MITLLFISLFISNWFIVKASNVNYCQNLHPTHDFDEEALLGMWFIREYIYHKEKATRTEYNPYCPIIQIRKFEDYVQGGLISRSLVSLKVFFCRLDKNGTSFK